MRCSCCGNVFPPSAALYSGTQLFTDHATGDVWLYLLQFTCPGRLANGERCGSTRCVVMFDAVDEDEEAQAAE